MGWEPSPYVLLALGGVLPCSSRVATHDTRPMRAWAYKAKGWVLWGGPLRLILWRWRVCDRERVELKRRVRDLELRLSDTLRP